MAHEIDYRPVNLLFFFSFKYYRVVSRYIIRTRGGVSPPRRRVQSEQNRTEYLFGKRNTYNVYVLK